MLTAKLSSHGCGRDRLGRHGAGDVDAGVGDQDIDGLIGKRAAERRDIGEIGRHSRPVHLDRRARMARSASARVGCAAGGDDAPAVRRILAREFEAECRGSHPVMSTVGIQAVSSKSSRPISMRRISEVPAPIS